MHHRTLLLLVIALFALSARATEPPPVNQLPMYGERPKSAALTKADEDFVQSFQTMGISRQEAAKMVLAKAWSSWTDRDFSTAMRRFNQAWLLDADNAEAYYGFALITAVRGGSNTEVERLFTLAITKPSANADLHVKYGRFLGMQKQFDKSLAQLNRALALCSTAHNARSNASMVYYLQGDFGKACTWAKTAKENGDELEPGYLEDMCRRAK